MEMYVIIGASLAGAKAAETLREEGFDGRIVLIGEEGERPYERPPLSKGYLIGPAERAVAYVHDEQWYADQGIDLRLAVRATMLDPVSRALTLDGGEQLRYDKLLLATGSRVRMLDVPGADLRGVRYLRTFDESESLRDALVPEARVVVVGAGWIGMETAAAARTRGAEVTVVEVDSLPLRRVLGDEVARIYADLHAEHGVGFRFGSIVAEITGSAHASGVRLSDGELLPADVVVVGVGVRPAVELAEAASLDVDNGVVTDERLRTSDPAIYACGDAANSYHPMIGKRIRVEHWANALNGGKAAARSMLGQEVAYDRVPYFFSDQYDLGMEYAGYVEPDGYEQVVFRGDPVAREFIAFWLADGRVLAGMNANVWDVTESIQRLVRAGYAGKTVDPRRLADTSVALEDLA
ncbi:MAG: NAD(P)/FAD-dependent oxidoreductase [Micromonosporaceae bacterium]|nr:NAD(P)/FAD-dependent oxidoreductase [Micromonosporaceae bacterium]